MSHDLTRPDEPLVQMPKDMWEALIEAAEDGMDGRPRGAPVAADEALKVVKAIVYGVPSREL